MDCTALGDNWPLECAVFQEIDASPDIHATFDHSPGDDPVTDRGVRIAEEVQRVLDQNAEKDPATLTESLWSKSPPEAPAYVAFGRHCRDRTQSGSSS
jgi:hypothetical protein